jgi:hypothetical protein
MILKQGTEVILLAGSSQGQTAIVKSDYGDQVLVYQEDWMTLTFFMDKQNLQVVS